MSAKVMKPHKNIRKSAKRMHTHAKNLVIRYLTSKRSYNRKFKSFRDSFIFNDSLMRKVNATAPRGKCYKRMAAAGLIKNKWGYYDDQP